MILAKTVKNRFCIDLAGCSVFVSFFSCEFKVPFDWSVPRFFVKAVGVVPHHTTLRFACMVLFALRAYRFSEARAGYVGGVRSCCGETLPTALAIACL